MISIKRFLLITVLACLQTGLSGQTMFDVFADNNYTDGGIICDMIKDTNCVVIAGSTVDSTYVGFANSAFRLDNRPFVKKIDENGNTLWSIVPNDSTDYLISNAKAIFTRIIRSGNYIYAYFISTSSRRLFKIDFNNGSIIWNKIMPNSNIVGGAASLRYNINYLVDYDATKLVLTYEDPSMVNHQHLAAFIDKQSGDTLSTYQIGRTWGSNSRTDKYAINKDSLGSLYYTSYDTLVKTYHANHDSILWKSSFDSLGIGRF